MDKASRNRECESSRGSWQCQQSPDDWKLTVFCSAAQRKLFGIYRQKQLKLTVLCSARSKRAFWSFLESSRASICDVVFHSEFVSPYH
jgi:hypothetical protein